MKIDVKSKMTIDVDEEQLDDIVAKYVYDFYWDALDDLTEDERPHFEFMYKFFSGRDLNVLNVR